MYIMLDIIHLYFRLCFCVLNLIQIEEMSENNPLGQILGYHDKMALNSTKQNTDGSTRHILTTIKQT